MSRVRSWIDRHTLRQLLADAGLALAAKPAVDPVDLLVEPDAPAGPGCLPPFFTDPEAPLDQTLERFLAELREISGCEAALLADTNGLLLAGRGDEALIAGTAVLDRALRTIREAVEVDVGASLVVELGSRLFAQMVWVESSHEQVIAILIVKRPLGSDFIDAVRNTVGRLLRAPDAQGEL